jgi:hypothetical protein
MSLLSLICSVFASGKLSAEDINRVDQYLEEKVYSEVELVLLDSLIDAVVEGRFVTNHTDLTVFQESFFLEK